MRNRAVVVVASIILVAGMVCLFTFRRTPAIVPAAVPTTLEMTPAPQTPQEPADRPRTLKEYQASAIVSKHPELVWIQALEEDDAAIVRWALRQLFTVDNAAFLEPLRKTYRKWAPKASHDGPPIAEQTALTIEKIEAFLSFQRELPESLQGSARFEKTLELAKAPQGNSTFTALLLKELYKSNDPRIVPVLLEDSRTTSYEKLRSLGVVGGPALLEVLRSSSNQKAQGKAAVLLGELNYKEGFQAIIERLSKLNSSELSGKGGDGNASRSFGNLVMALEAYGPEALDDLVAASKGGNLSTRRGIYTVMGRMGGPKALSHLKAAKQQESALPDSSDSDIADILNLFINRIERGDND